MLQSKFKNVKSSNLKSIAYQANIQELKVVFINAPNWIYVYSLVPLAIYTKLKNSPSKGMYFNEHIKNEYQFRKIVNSAKWIERIFYT